MRTTFIETLCERAAKDSLIWLVCGDLGFSVLERFYEKFPDRYINAGVAEQNMTGIAAGLAFEGKKAITYSIANFPTLRCLEQIRNDVCYHEADVKVVAVGGGFSYGNLGYTHHGIEDIAIMRSLPNMHVFVPADPYETKWATEMMLDLKGPCYLRLGKTKEPAIHEKPVSASLGIPLTVRPGREVLLVSAGAILKNVVDAADILNSKGMEAGVLSCPVVKPLSEKELLRMCGDAKTVATVEEHSLTNGFGTAVLEALQAGGFDTRKLVRIAAPNRVPSVIGDQDFLRSSSGLSAEMIAETVLLKMKGLSS